MSDPPIVEYRPTCLVIIPGIEFDEWQAAWESLDQTSRSINWLIGDALVYGESAYPDRWSQVLDPKYTEAHRGALRVAQRIPKEYRRDPATLSWSAHREACAAETLEERAEILDLAEAGGWGSREVAAELKRRRDSRRGNGGPPLDDPGSTWNDRPADPATTGLPEDIAGSGAPVAPSAGEAPAAPVALLTYQPQPATTSDVLSVIEAVRQVANNIALKIALLSDIDRVEDRVAAIIRQPSAGALTSHNRAIATVPAATRGRIEIEFSEHVFGGRSYAVSLRDRTGKEAGYGKGPSLPCAIVEAALTTMLRRNIGG